MADESSMPKTTRLFLGHGVPLELNLIPAGQFLMGSTDFEEKRDDDEGPLHQVIISRPFYMGINQVTQEQYEAVMGVNPSDFKGARNPVEEVSWYDAVAFCTILSENAKQKVRLPTEAEWEYACRAGSRTRFSFGDDDDKLGDYAWYLDNSGRKARTVGLKKPNPWGLYDMHGNVWEWCSDWYADSYVNTANCDPQGPPNGSTRVLRGNSWISYAWGCRSALRYGYDPSYRSNKFGFRVAVVAAGLE
jgi:formylglycine-generating enzyme required for sulfatase activity